jgi:cell division GTPase FtsZ
MFELMDTQTQTAVIKVIGVGGGGGNAVNHMAAANIEGVDFICANTDAQALDNATVKTILQLGAGTPSRSRSRAGGACRSRSRASRSWASTAIR